MPQSLSHPPDRSDPRGPYTSIGDLIHRQATANRLGAIWKTSPQAMIAGASISRFRGRGIEFSEVRAYEAGDDVRSIDWRVTARKGRVHTKLFHEERERPMLTLVDQSPSMFFGSRLKFKSVAAADMAALLSWAALKHGDRIGGIVLGATTCAAVRPQRSKRNVLHLLRLIDDFNHLLQSPQAGAEDLRLTQAIERILRLSHTGGQIHIISDFYDLRSEQALQDTRRQLRRLRRHNDVSLIMVYDPLETQLPDMGLYLVTDGRSRTQVDAGARSTRQSYQQRFEARVQRVQTLCQEQRLDLLQLSTTDSPLETLLGRSGRKA